MATTKKFDGVYKPSESTRKIEVFYKWQETKTGKKFKKWLTKTKDEKIYQVNFCGEALRTMPEARATIYVDESNMNWSRKNPKYPELYIKKIDHIELKESAPENFDIYFEKA